MANKMNSLGLDPDVFYSSVLKEAKTMVTKLGIKVISLENWTLEQRADDGTWIPEPTKEGAQQLAVLISSTLVEWS